MKSKNWLYSTHPHGYRIDEDGIGRYENICAIREITPEEVAIGTEWVCDRYANIVDYIHGCGNARGYSPSAYPDIYLHVKYLTDIKAQYAKYFYHGNFVSMFKEPVPTGVRSAKFVSKDGDYIVAFWNTTGKDVAFQLYGKAITVRANDVAVMEYKEHLCTPSF